MALPAQFKSARMVNTTKRSVIDNKVGELEAVITDVFGLTIDVDITAAALQLTNDGKISNMPYLSGTTPGFRLRDTGDNDGLKIELTGGELVVYENTGTEGTPIWTERNALVLSTGQWDVGQAPLACKAWDATNSVATATQESITFANEHYDTGSLHSTSSSTYKFTVPAGMDGIWRFDVFAAIQSFAGTFLRVEIMKNLATGLGDVGANFMPIADSFVDVLGTVAFEGNLVAGDFLAVTAEHDHGSAATVLSEASFRYIGAI